MISFYSLNYVKCNFLCNDGHYIRLCIFTSFTIRISDQLMCVCDSKPTFLDAHEETFSTLSIHSSDTYINFWIISLILIQYKTILNLSILDFVFACDLFNSISKYHMSMLITYSFALNCLKYFKVIGVYIQT